MGLSPGLVVKFPSGCPSRSPLAVAQDVKVAIPFTAKKVQHHHLCGVLPSQTIPLSEAVGFAESHNGSHRDEGV